FYELVQTQNERKNLCGYFTRTCQPRMFHGAVCKERERERERD
ncbi:MAG: hypothetical protein ACI8RD_012868, partial [Bacillariaceae sp.]